MSDKSTGFVRVMRSHKYNQFEVCLPLPDNLNPGSALRGQCVDDLRKECARLVDKAVRQYDDMIRVEQLTESLSEVQVDRLRKQVEEIYQVPVALRTPEQKAQVQFLKDFDYKNLVGGYNYGDDDRDDYGEQTAEALVESGD